MASRTAESALVILPPKDTWNQINEIRKVLDRAYPRWMPHINLIYPFVKDTEFLMEQLKIAKHLSQIKPFTVSLKKESFGHFIHGKSGTIWVKPVVPADVIPQDGATETLQVAPAFEVQKPPKKVLKTVKKMVKKTIPVEVYEDVPAQTIFWCANPNPYNYPVTSGLDALRDAFWSDNVIELKRTPSEEYGMDLLRYAVWGTESNKNIYPEIGGVQKFQKKNVCLINSDKFLGPSINVGEKKKKRVEYQEVWEEVEVQEGEEQEKENGKREEECAEEDDGFEVVGQKKKQKIKKNLKMQKYENNDGNMSGCTTSPELLNLQRKLREMYPEDGSGVNGDFNPHLTLGQSKTPAVASALEKWKKNWKDITFEVKEIHLISRRGQGENFVIRKIVPFGVLNNDL